MVFIGEAGELIIIRYNFHNALYCKYIIKKAFKNYVIFDGGRGEVTKRLRRITRGGEGGLRPPKLDYVIVECYLTC